MKHGTALSTVVVVPARVEGPTQAEVLAEALREKERALEAARRELEAVDPGRLYDEAKGLGVVQALEGSPLSDPQRRRLAIAIVREARRQGLDPLLVVAVIRSESSFNDRAVSPVGAVGLMQVMPDTGDYLARRRGFRLRHASNLFDHEVNVELGTAYLADLIQRFRSVEAALVAYNAGPGAARRILANEAHRRRFVDGYPRKVLDELDRLKALNAADVATREPTLPRSTSPNEASLYPGVGSHRG
jgi:soluble lytic murein transglycosylase